MKNENKFLKIEERVSQGEQANIVCRQMGVDPHALYAWRSRNKKKGGAKVIVHQATTEARGYKKKATKALPQGYMVFGSAEFLKSFAGLQ